MSEGLSLTLRGNKCCLQRRFGGLTVETRQITLFAATVCICILFVAKRFLGFMEIRLANDFQAIII